MAATGILRITDTFQYIPKTFNSPNTTIEYYLQQEIADIISILRDPLNTLPFLYYGDASKIRSIGLLIFCKEAQIIIACKSYHCPQFYHRVRIKIFYYQKSPASQHHLLGWNQFHNLQEFKHDSRNPYCLQGCNIKQPLA